jgi:hypothetical protein
MREFEVSHKNENSIRKTQDARLTMPKMQWQNRVQNLPFFPELR